jgi:hypothetical protein
MQTYVYATGKPYGSGLWLAHVNIYDGGNDGGVRKIGKGFKSDADARAACREHYAKVTKAATNFGRQVPVAIF